MSIAKKLALLIVPAVALVLPLSAASSAQAYDHHDYHSHVVHYDHFGYGTHFDRRVLVSPRIVISPVVPLQFGVGVAYRPVSVFYRTNVLSPWVTYGSYGAFADAEVVAGSLRLRGLDVFIR